MQGKKRQQFMFIFLVLLVLLLFASCSLFKFGRAKQQYICKEGEIVSNITDCPEYQETFMQNETEPKVVEPEKVYGSP